jgi:hypothetical protein
MAETKIVYNGISFTGLLFIVLLVLKITGHLTWSWWWVTAPLWGPLALGVGVLVLVLILWIIMFSFFKKS